MLYKTVKLARLFSIVCLLTLASCESAGLPQAAQAQLDKHIAEMVGSELDYEVVSVQKASGQPDDVQVEMGSPFDANPGVCPTNKGGEDTWCVVIGGSVTTDDGDSVSHFLVYREGVSWRVEGLADSEDGAFYFAGCNNWEAANASSQ